MLGRGWKTLRFRLAAWNAVVVMLTALVVLIALREGVRWAILHEMDAILREDSEEIVLALRDLSPDQFHLLTDELERKAIGHRHHGWFAQLVGADGAVIWSNADAPDVGALEPPRSGSPQSVGHHRLLERRVDHHAGKVALVRVGSRLDFLRTNLGRIDRLVLLSVGLVLVMGPLVSYWLAGRATKTVGEITKSAERLRPDYLDERLPIRGTGDELDRLALTVNGLLDRIAAYLAQKRDLLANAAHELRTPLAAIRSSIEVALGSRRSETEYQDLLVDVIDQAAALETLVNQLLLISESEAQRLKVDQDLVDLSELARQSAEMFAGIAEARNVALDVPASEAVAIRGNRRLLRQVINNLIDNAIKYTPAGGRVTVEVSRDPRRRKAILTVSDTGIGISPSDVPKVFDRFFRGDKARTRPAKAAGTGLGLSICQAAVAAHQGQISCHSELAKGSTFVVELPGSAS